jgi:hypothetical protein
MNKKGIVLILSFGVIAVMLLLAGAAASRSIYETKMAQRHFESVQAFWLAEAGVNRALKELRNNYELLGIPATNLGSGGYSVVINNPQDGTRVVSAAGYVPRSGPVRSQRVLEAIMYKYPSVPSHFYENAIYTAQNIVLNGSSFDVIGNVRYAGTITGNTSRIIGTKTQDPAVAPLAHLDFTQLRALSQAQGNYHDARHLNGPFPLTFWYNEDQSIPNIVFLEGNLDLTGKTTVGGFFVVGGEVVYDATLSGNVSVKGAIYTLGRFTVNGGGNALNIDGGVWCGQQATLNGNAKISYNSAYVEAIQALGINTTVGIKSWRDTQEPYAL